MRASKIQAAERPVVEIFSNDFQFSIPRYQRPYSWTTEQAGEMYDDLLAAARAKPALDDTDPYFLGSIVLVKGEKDPAADVVDGQQRLTTLTLLVSMLREHASTELAQSLDGCIFQKGDPLLGTIDQPRLRLRALDQDFFEKYLQDRNGVSALASLSTDSLPESQANLVGNARHFLQRLSELDTETCDRLARFVALQTYLVIVATQDFDSAYRIFTVLNERGLDLTHTDILKSEIIGALPPAQQDAYTQKWEAEEEDLGRDDFADLFSHIRMVFAKSKARESILGEFRSSVLTRVADGQTFIDEVLIPLSDAYEVATRCDYKAAEGADKVNDLFRWLNRLGNTDWVPPAIAYLSRADVTTAMLTSYLVDLERLAASLLIRRVDLTRRIERYGRVLEAVDGGADLLAPESPLQLSDDERAETVERLNGEIYTVTRMRLYVLLRLDAALATEGVIHDDPVVTVEHVLPQNPAVDSVWTRWFTEEERRRWVHRLANLVLLTRRKNSEASNFEFEEKKLRYFTTRSGVSPFALTTQVIHKTEWTPALLERRQDELVGTLADVWRLR